MPTAVDLWDSVPDIELEEAKPDYSRWLLRSKPDYPSQAPGGGEWGPYFAALREEFNATHGVAEDDDEDDIVITSPAAEFDDPCGPLATYVKLLHAGGWTLVELAEAHAFAKGKPFKSGANEGTLRPDQTIRTQWVKASRNDDKQRVLVAYTIVNDTVRGTSTVRRYNGNSYADKDLKAIVKS